MADKYFKNHPMYRKSIQEGGDNTKNVFLKFQEEIGHCFDTQDRNIKILEIGLGRGDFAHFCEKKGFKNYTGIDIDDTHIAQLKSNFKNFTFLEADIVEFLAKNTDTYDIIFMAHVFEHLSPDVANKSIQLIYSHLKNVGYWINYMPNADSTKACALRYIDITHKSIYNTHSFEQILLTNDADFSEIKHFNTLPSINPHIKWVFKLIHPIFLVSTKIYYYGMGLFFPKIYTSEILSIMRK